MKKNNKHYTRDKTHEELISIRGGLLGSSDKNNAVVYPIKNKVNRFLRGVGIISLVIAILPNGLGFVFYPVAFSLLGISVIDIKRGWFIIRYKFKYGVTIRELKIKLLLYKNKRKINKYPKLRV